MTTYKSALILLHGSGGDGTTLSKYIQEIHPTFFNQLEMSRIKVILPTSDFLPYSILDGKQTRVWHDRKSLSYDSVEDTEGLDKTHNSIKKIILELWKSYRIDISNIIIGGFSMGGGVALHFTLSEWYDFPAVICIGSYVTTRSNIWKKKENVISYQINPKIIIMHGDEDLLIPIEWSKKTKDLLLLKNYDVDFTILKGVKHEMSFYSLNYILTFITNILC